MKTKPASSINITLNDFKFTPDECRFLDVYVWAFYNLFARPIADKLRHFCAEMRNHPSLRVRYIIVAGKDRVSEAFSLHTGWGASFLTLDITQTAKMQAVDPTVTHLSNTELADKFDAFMVTNAKASYKTSNPAIHVDIQTISYLLRPLIMSLSELNVRGTVEVNSDVFTLHLENQVDGTDVTVNVKFHNTNIKGKSS